MTHLGSRVVVEKNEIWQWAPRTMSSACGRLFERGRLKLALGSSTRPSWSPRRARSPATLSITAALRIEIVREGVRRGGQLTFCDNGPGIADIKAAMTDGFTTTGRFGLELSGVKRLSNEFSIESAPGKGTTVHPMQSQVKGTGLGLARHIRSALGDPVLFP